MDRARMSAIMNAEKLEVTVKSRYWCVFPEKFSFVFISKIFSSEVMLFKAIFIHLFSHFLDHEINLRYFPNQKCHDSNHENSCNDSSKGFLRHKLLSGMVWKLFRYRLLLITSLLNQWINPAPVKLDLDPNQADLIKFQLSKNDSMEGIRFFWWR